MGSTCSTQTRRPRVETNGRSAATEHTPNIFKQKRVVETFRFMSYDIMPFEVFLLSSDPKPSIIVSQKRPKASRVRKNIIVFVEKSYDGARYKNKWHGRGVLVTKDKYLYEGEFDQGDVCGFGTLTTPDGSVVKGYWQCGRLQGEGSEKWADNMSYEGDYKDGLKDGQGTFKWPHNQHYKGEWKNDLPHGNVV